MIGATAAASVFFDAGFKFNGDLLPFACAGNFRHPAASERFMEYLIARMEQ